MNSDYAHLAALIKGNFIPVVLVIASSEAEDLCKKNALSLVQLFSKFCFSFISQTVKG